MTVYNFSEVAVWDNLGGAVRVARNARVDVTDPSTNALAPDLTQNGQPVTYLTSDGNGQVKFTSTIGAVLLSVAGSAPVAAISPNATAGGGGVTDHGALTGLADDDHTQYAKSDGTRGAFATTAQGTLATNAVPNTRSVIAGTGLTGGGALSADRTLTVAYGTSSTTAAVGNDARFTDPQYDVNTVGASGSTETLPATSAAHKVTMDQSCTFTFTAPTKAGHTFLLYLSGAFTPTFPASVKWDGGTAPTYATPSVYSFTTFDTGVTWLGAQVAKAIA